jgi:salicylate hydroxylase
MNRKAIIVGGGIGGLTAAICLREIGWDVQIFETAPLISEIGAGIQISPNGVKVLQKIGVMPLLEEILF